MSDELIVARTVSEVSLWGIGRNLGDPVLFDDGSQPEMVDILFPNTDPPAAMEITSIVDGDFVSTASASQKAVERRLTKVAENSGRAIHWTFQIISGTGVKPLEPLMTEIILSGDPPAGRDIAPGLIRVDTEPSEAPSVGIATWSSPTAGPLRGLDPELGWAIESKRSKLSKAEGYERHLAVDVVDLRASDPGSTPCPPLPEEIDFLWITRRAYSFSRGSPVVWVTDGSQEWKVNGEPHEAM